MELFGNPYIFTFASANGEQTPIGAPFWYLISLISTYLLWWLVKMGLKKKEKKQDHNLTVTASPNL